jgi:hypothetical protein
MGWLRLIRMVSSVVADLANSNQFDSSQMDWQLQLREPSLFKVFLFVMCGVFTLTILFLLVALVLKRILSEWLAGFESTAVKRRFLRNDYLFSPIITV